MVVTSRQTYNYKWFEPDDTVLVTSATETDTTSTSYTKVNEIQFQNDYNPNSRFRIKWEHRTANSSYTSTTILYQNGVAISGTSDATVQEAYQTVTMDLTSTIWRKGDKLQLYAKISNASSHAYTRNLQICGLESEFEVLL